MKSEQLKSEINALKAQLSQIGQEILVKKSALFLELTKEAGLERGDKVTLYNGGDKIGTGFFVCFMEKYGRICAAVKKSKKDGTPSLNDWDNYYFDRIEKAAK